MRFVAFAVLRLTLLKHSGTPNLTHLVYRLGDNPEHLDTHGGGSASPKSLTAFAATWLGKRSLLRMTLRNSVDAIMRELANKYTVEKNKRWYLACEGSAIGML